MPCPWWLWSWSCGARGIDRSKDGGEGGAGPRPRRHLASHRRYFTCPGCWPVISRQYQGSLSMLSPTPGFPSGLGPRLPPRSISRRGPIFRTMCVLDYGCVTYSTFLAFWANTFQQNWPPRSRNHHAIVRLAQLDGKPPLSYRVSTAYSSGGATSPDLKNQPPSFVTSEIGRLWPLGEGET